jgi:predicted transcriptional regulator
MPDVGVSVRVRDLVQEIIGVLECSQKQICSLVGITPTALSMSIERPYGEVADNKVGKRLSSLVYLVETLRRDRSLDAQQIMKVLVTPAYKMEDGTYMDAVAAIHMGDFRNEHLVDIADAALKKLRSEYETEKRPARNSLYERMVAAKRA